LHPSYEGSSSPLKDLDLDCDPARYLPDHDYTNFQIVKASATRQVAEIARAGFDLAINLCDGAWEEDRAGIEVVQALERLGVAFTGSGSAFYDPSREAMKMASHSVSVDFPAYVTAAANADVDWAARELRFPLIVKPPRGYSSVGLTRESRVTSVAALRREAARMREAYGSALVEEFIEGREFTVLVAESRVDDDEAWALQPVEFLFPEGESFKHFDLKWKDYEKLGTRAVEEPLAARLREASALTFAALGGTGYARCDLRMDASGRLYMLEINPYCGVFYPEGQFGSADFILASDPAGHRGFLEHLIHRAFRRRDRARKAWTLRYRAGRGFGMFAAREIAAGEIVEAYEERPQVLVSRQHVKQCWSGLRKEWFERYAWPVSSGVSAMWSENPEDWRPIDHSCDPNAWLDGLDLAARRDISCGEEIAVDYATFCGPEMAAFECRCASPRCRGTIRGTDCLLPEIRERYRDHVSDFIRDCWRREEVHAASAGAGGLHAPA
jgi:D-alanine-D-alanine ligase